MVENGYPDAAAIYGELGRIIEALEEMQAGDRLTVAHGGRAETAAAVRATLDALYTGREACSTLQTDQQLGN